MALIIQRKKIDLHSNGVLKLFEIVDCINSIFNDFSKFALKLH